MCNIITSFLYEDLLTRKLVPRFIFKKATDQNLRIIGDLCPELCLTFEPKNLNQVTTMEVTIPRSTHLPKFL